MKRQVTVASALQDTGMSLFGSARDYLHRKVAFSNMPQKEYVSLTFTYGAYLNYDEEGRLVWSNSGIMPVVDKIGDYYLRQFDDNYMDNPLKTVERKKSINPLDVLLPGPKRSRASVGEIMQNVRRLGLSDYYGLHRSGVEFKRKEVYEHGVSLQDIWRSDIIKSPILLDIDRFAALASAVRYVKSLHIAANGGIGELLINDILFPRNSDGKLETPVLNIPDIVFNSGKRIPPLEQKAIDILDFMFSVSAEEVRRSGDKNQICRVYEVIVHQYDDRHVMDLVYTFIRRGRMTLMGDASQAQLPGFLASLFKDLVEVHNSVRLFGAKAELRQLVLRVLEEYNKRTYGQTS